MKKFYFIMATALMCSMSAMADQLTVSQALSRLAKSPRKSAAQIGKVSDFKLAYTATSGKNNCFYVVNNIKRGGFNVLAADDCAPAVLMSIDDAAFDMNNMPAQLKGLLNHYQNAISAAIASGKSLHKLAPSNDPSDIGPLMRTVWQQAAPFNNDCTELLNAGLVPENEKSIVGCVATAAAQCLFYFYDAFGYEAKPQGTAKYTLNYKGNSSIAETKAGTIEIEKDLSDVTIDWANCILQYDGYTYSDEQAAAVANLSHIVGLTLKMNYEDKTGGSGTQDENIPTAFKDNWGFDESVAYVERTPKDEGKKKYEDQEWTDLIFGELKAGCPVMYGAVGRKADGTDGGGHEFVIDGYRTSDDLFHVNWGWENGYCNGWCYLVNEDLRKVLLPQSTTAGSTGSADSTDDPYSNGQGAIINIKPQGFNDMQPLDTRKGTEGTKKTDESTGITTITSAASNGMIYNIAGQRVNPYTKGFQIKNGKKSFKM